MEPVSINESKLLYGAEELNNVIRRSIGPNGRSVLLDKGYGVISQSTDGFEISKVISPEDNVELLGMTLLKAVAERMHENVGDGVKTSVILAYKLMSEGLKCVQAGISFVAIINFLEKFLEYVCCRIDDMKIPVTDMDGLLKVARSAGCSESLLCEIRPALEAISGNAIVSISEGKEKDIEIESYNGLVLDNGYSSVYFLKDKDVKEICLENVYILLSEASISSFEDICPIIEKIGNEQAALLILSPGLEKDVLSNLLLNVHKKNLKAVAVNAGGYAVSGLEVLEDVAVFTKAKILRKHCYKRGENIFDYLGRAETVRIDSRRTVIASSYGDEEEIEAHARTIRAELDNTKDKAKKLTLNSRLFNISRNKLCVKVGGTTKSQLFDKKRRIERVFASCTHAYNNGAVYFGGLCYLSCVEELRQMKDSMSDDEKAAAYILIEALKSPTYYMVNNSEKSGKMIIEKLLEMKCQFGFDIIKNEYVELDAVDMLDAADVIKEALINAVSVAEVFLASVRKPTKAF